MAILAKIKQIGVSWFLLTVVFFAICMVLELGSVASGTVIFIDDFESGDFSAWSGTTGSPWMQSFVSHSGSFAAMANSTEQQRCFQSITDSNHLFGRFFYKFGPMNAEWVTHELIHMTDIDTPIAIGGVAIAHATGTDYWWVLEGLVGDTYDVVDTSAWFTMDLDRWYCIELETYVDDSAGYVKLFIDDVLVANSTSSGIDNNNYGGIDHVNCGSYWAERAGEYVWWDDCVIADSYIGLEAPTDLSISVSPASITLNEGQTQEFTAIASDGTGPFTYAWYVDDVLQVGETSSTFTYTATLGDTEVSATVTDDTSATASDSAIVAVNSPTPAPTPAPTATPTQTTPSPTTSPESTPTLSPTISPTQTPSPEPEPQNTDLPIEYLIVAAGIFVASAATAAFLMLKKKK